MLFIYSRYDTEGINNLNILEQVEKSRRFGPF